MLKHLFRLNPLLSAPILYYPCRFFPRAVFKEQQLQKQTKYRMRADMAQRAIDEKSVKTRKDHSQLKD